MGYDLRNAGGEPFRLTESGWRELLNLAFAHGWHPEGTDIDPRANIEFDLLIEQGKVVADDRQEYIAKMRHAWDGGYFWNSGQRVSAEDALAIADALEQMLRNGVVPKPLDPDTIREFATFCQGGSFRIG